MCPVFQEPFREVAMGKAGTRRRRNRMKRFARAASADPDAFVRSWRRRLDSWCREIDRRAGRLRLDADRGWERRGRRAEPCFEVLERALELAGACGGRNLPMAWGRYRGTVYSVTRDVLVHACERAVAREVSPALGMPLPTERICRRLEDLAAAGNGR